MEMLQEKNTWLPQTKIYKKKKKIEKREMADELTD